ncbi:MAG: hypothetical protein HZA83_01845 [Thaumarchaeota archaeon]|nr:hypothetical protein [Nitrososphaerota archaeon]
MIDESRRALMRMIETAVSGQSGRSGTCELELTSASTQLFNVVGGGPASIASGSTVIAQINNELAAGGYNFRVDFSTAGRWYKKPHSPVAAEQATVPLTLVGTR